jgi:hypothetical protein
MMLCAIKGQQFSRARDLSDDELSSHEKYWPLVIEAGSRLKLFNILQMNYQEWRDYLDELLTTAPGDPEQQHMELNRLILNYLSSAYMIHQHFDVSFKQRFRNDEKKCKEHEEVLARLSSKCWAFGFFFDFRGFVQHRGLAVGVYKRGVSATRVEISLSQDPAVLLKQSRDWKRSKLARHNADLDLIELLREFHLCMLNGYSRFIIDTFYPELVPADEFYSKLTIEALGQAPGRMVFIDNLSEDGTPIDKLELNIHHVPNNLFLEFGMTAPQGAKF